MVRLIALIGAFVLAAPVAAGQDFTVKKTIGEWTVYRYSDDCWMRTDLPNGTNLAFSTAQKNADLYIKLMNAGWQSVTDDGQYDLRVRFGSLDRVKTAYGSSAQGTLPPGVALFLDGSSDAYIGALRASATIRVTMGDKDLAETSLTGEDTGQAFDYLRRCTASMKSEAGDPFAGRTPQGDPFKK
jgi:hypothetical protein